MDDFCLHKGNIALLLQKLMELVTSGKRWRIKITEWRELRTIPMNSTWRMWMNETAEWMRNQGVTVDIKNGKGQVISRHRVTPEDAHEMFVSRHLGVDENGDREKTSKMEIGRKLYLMELHEAWCLEKGIPLTIPKKSQFYELKQKQVA